MIKNYKRVYYKMSYYPPYKSSSNNVKVELDLTNYAKKKRILKILLMLMLVVLLVKLI